MSKHKLDSIIHSPKRLQICALLVPLHEAEFQMLLAELEVSDSVLSKHIKQLVDLGYIKQRKAPFERHRRTWVRLTKKGRNAFENHVKELRALIKSTGL